tara:strand:+ start:6896 stop:9220 length:2325 start_codon:yes stop_codon:yes gene_type:complete
MADNKDIVELEINVEVTTAQKNVNKLTEEVERLTKASRTGGITDAKRKKTTDELAAAKAKLALEERKLSNAVAKQTNAEQNSTSAINKQIQALKLEQAQLSKNSAAYAKNASEISMLSGKLNAQTKSSGAATASVMELGRVISDAPYGIRGVANNLTQLGSLFASTAKQAGGFTGALKQMGKQLIGPMGILLLFTTVIAYLDHMSQQAKTAKKDMNSLASVFGENTTKLLILKQTLNDTSVSLETKNELIRLAKEEFEDLDLELGENERLTQNATIALDAYTLSLLKNAKAKAIAQLIQKEMNIQLEAEATAVADHVGEMEAFGLALVSSVAGTSYAAAKGVEIGLNAQEKAITESEKRVEKYMEMLKENNGEMALMLFGQDPKKGPTGPTGPKDKESKDHSLKQYDWTSYNNKLFDKHMKLFIHQERAKLIYQQGSEVRDLQFMRDSFKKKEKERLNEYLIKQNGIIADEKQTDATRQSARDASEAAQKAYDDEEKRADAEHKKVMENQELMHIDQLAEYDYHADIADKKRLLEKQGFEQQMSEVKESFMGKTIQKDYDARLAQVDAEIDLNRKELERAKKHGEDLDKIEDAFDKLREKRQKTEIERDAEVYAAKKAMMMDVMDSAISVFATMKNAQEKGSKEEKKYALMEIYAGAAKGLMNGVLIAGEAAQGTAAAAPFIYASVLATQFASIYGAVSQAKSVLNGGSPSGGGTKVETPTFAPNFEVVGNSSQNQLAQSISDQTNGPTRAYVVYEDIAEAGATSEQSIESSGI